MTERRNESRYLCADLVRIDWLVGEDDFYTEQVLLEDISQNGSCVQVEHAIPVGATIMLTIHEAAFVGVVCYCVFRDYGYFVGMKFAPDSRWTQDAVIPDHLTNLQLLLAGAR